jgi:hypothetical protein
LPHDTGGGGGGGGGVGTRIAKTTHFPWFPGLHLRALGKYELSAEAYKSIFFQLLERCGLEVVLEPPPSRQHGAAAAASAKVSFKEAAAAAVAGNNSHHHHATNFFNVTSFSRSMSQLWLTADGLREILNGVVKCYAALSQWKLLSAWVSMLDELRGKLTDRNEGQELPPWIHSVLTPYEYCDNAACIQRLQTFDTTNTTTTTATTETEPERRHVAATTEEDPDSSTRKKNPSGEHVGGVVDGMDKQAWTSKALLLRAMLSGGGGGGGGATDPDPKILQRTVCDALHAPLTLRSLSSAPSSCIATTSSWQDNPHPLTPLTPRSSPLTPQPLTLSPQHLPHAGMLAVGGRSEATAFREGLPFNRLFLRRM